MRLILAVTAFLIVGSASAWDGQDCADATERLRKAAAGAEDAGQELASSPSSSSLSQVRSTLIEAGDYLDRALRACGARVATPRPKNHDAATQQALRNIDQWTERMKRSDPRYLSVEAVLLRHVDFVIRGMPPQYWLPTLQLMYGAASDAVDSKASVPLQRF